MRILDRYLMKHLSIAVVFCSFTLIFLVLMADLFDHLTELMRNKAPFGLIFSYYLNLAPFAFVQTIPWATLLGCIFLLVNLNTHNELLAMKVSGLGISRIILPLLYIGFLIGTVTFLVNDRIVPLTFRRAQAILEQNIEQQIPVGRTSQTVIRNFTYFSMKNQLYYAKTFDVSENLLENVIIFAFDENHRVRRKLYAKEARWLGSSWKLFNVTDYETDAQGKIVGEPSASAESAYEPLTETPQEFLNAASESAFLSYRDLKEHILRLKENGLQAYSEAVELHFKLAAPSHSLIMMLIAVCFLAATRRKKVIALNVLYSIALVFSFHVMGAFALAMGKTGTLPPFLSAWANSFAFSVSSVFFLDRGNE
jgi:LPS export ABC transporter permease LptG